jgi:hypothetical protein
MVCPAARRSDDAHMYLDQLCQVETRVARAYVLRQHFLATVRDCPIHGRELFAVEPITMGDIVAIKGAILLGPWWARMTKPA